MSNFYASEAMPIATRFGKRNVIYCMIFSHGLMKVGKTKNIEKRLSQISCHGILSPLLESIIIVSVPNTTSLSRAESAMINALREKSEQKGHEVFSPIDQGEVVKIMISSASHGVTNRADDKKSGPIDYLSLVKASSMSASIILKAIYDLRRHGNHSFADYLQNMYDQSLELGSVDEMLEILTADTKKLAMFSEKYSVNIAHEH